MEEREKTNQEEEPTKAPEKDTEDTFFKRVKRGLPMVGRKTLKFFQNYGNNMKNEDMIKPKKEKRKQCKKQKKKIKPVEKTEHKSKENKSIVVNLYINDKSEK